MKSGWGRFIPAAKAADWERRPIPAAKAAGRAGLAAISAAEAAGGVGLAAIPAAKAALAGVSLGLRVIARLLSLVRRQG